MKQIYNAERSWKKAGVSPPKETLSSFIDGYIKRNEKGEPFTLANHQRVVSDLMDERDYQLKIYSERKKSGKTTIGGCDLLRNAVVYPDSEVVTVANDLEQSQSRAFASGVALCQKNPELMASVVRITQNEIRFTNGSVLRAIASEYKGAAGGRQRLTHFDELWAYSSERMVRLFEELTPPPSEKGAYILITSYAGHYGEGELLETLYKRGLSGKRIHKTLECYRDGGLFMFWSHKPRMPWQLGAEDKRYYEEQKKILRPGTYLRLHENRWVSSDDRFITEEAWSACVDADRTPVLSDKRLDVFVGLDLGIKHDSTGRVCVAYDRAANKVVIVSHRLWKPGKGHSVSLADVEADLLELKNKFRVRKILCDPWQALGLIERLKHVFGDAIEEFPQSVGNLTVCGETLYDLIRSRNLLSYPDSDLRSHIEQRWASRAREAFGCRRKRRAGKSTLCVALSMACVGALQNIQPVANPNALPIGVGNGGIGSAIRRTFGSTLTQPFPGGSTFGPAPDEERPGKGGAWLYGFNWG